MPGIKRKSIKFIVITLLTLLIISAAAFPAMAASPGKANLSSVGTSPAHKVLKIQGLATGSITFTPDNSTAITLKMPAEKVNAVYTVSGAINTLQSLKAIPIKPVFTTKNSAIILNKVTGIAAGNIIVTPKKGTAVKIIMPADTVRIEYVVMNGTNILRSLTIFPKPTPQPAATPPSDNLTSIKGYASGSVTVTTDIGTSVTLAMPSSIVKADYIISGTTNTLKKFTSNMPNATAALTSNTAVPVFACIQGTITGTITITGDNGTTVTLSMPSDKMNVVYSISGTTNTLLSINKGGDIDGPCGTKKGQAK